MMSSWLEPDQPNDKQVFKHQPLYNNQLHTTAHKHPLQLPLRLKSRIPNAYYYQSSYPVPFIQRDLLRKQKMNRKQQYSQILILIQSKNNLSTQTYLYIYYFENIQFLLLYTCMDKEDIIKKTEQFINKNRDLLEQKKYYEFAQKVKLMSHRKLQSKRTNQAVIMLQLGADALLSIGQMEQNAALQLIDQLVQAITIQPQLLTSDLEKSFLTLIQRRPLTNRKLEIIKTLIDKTEKVSKCTELKTFYINFNANNGSFANVLKMVCELNPEKSYEFVQKWTAHKNILKEQIPAIWCRMALLRGLLNGVDDGQEMFRKVTKELNNYHNDEPYTVFSGFLFKVVRINSKQAFLAMERSYYQFLESDPFFQNLFNGYGKKFFGIDKSKSGIMSLIS